MNRLICALAIVLGLLGIHSSSGLAATFDLTNWYQIARMSDADAGMFDGNGELLPTYSYGTFIDPLQDDDFERTFTPYDGMQILFLTGDQEIWGITSYSTLRALIDAAAGVISSTNISFDSSINGIAQATNGNVLSRSGITEDPWISLSGDHIAGIAADLIIWGESDYVGPHADLKNAHNGVNVYVSTPVSAVPLPAALPLLGAGLAGLGAIGWGRRRRGARSDA